MYGKTKTLTIDTNAYLANDALHALDYIELSSSDIAIKAIQVIDKHKEGNSLTLMLFDQSFTAAGLNEPFTLSDADASKLIRQVALTSATESKGAAFNYYIKENANILSQLTNAQNRLYFQLVTNDAATYAAATDLEIRFEIIDGRKL